MKRRQNQIDGGKNTNMQWDVLIDDTLIDVLVLWDMNGDNVNGIFTTIVYDSVLNEVNGKLGT